VLGLFGRGHRCGRRLLAHGRQAGRHPAAPRPGSQGLANLHNARKGQLGHRQHRGRARDVPHQARRAAHLGTSRASRARSPHGAHVAQRPARSPPTGPPPSGGAPAPGQVATLILPATRVNEPTGWRRCHPRRPCARRRGGDRSQRQGAPHRRAGEADAHSASRSASAACALAAASPPRPGAHHRPGLQRPHPARRPRVPIERLPYPVDQAPRC